MKNFYILHLFIICFLAVVIPFGNAEAQTDKFFSDNSLVSQNNEKLFADNNIKNIKLFPNPSTNYFYLSSDSGVSIKRLYDDCAALKLLRNAR